VGLEPNPGAVPFITGKDNVVRGVKILTKGHTIERPLSLVCSLELKETEFELTEAKGDEAKRNGRNRTTKE
jgi:hypothetical protein